MTMLLMDLPYCIALTVLAALVGLAVKLVASRLDIKRFQQQAAFFDEYTGRLLVRRSPTKTFAGLYAWNLLISAAIIASGLITLGVLPLVWAFLNLGLFGSSINMLKRYLHAWLEGAATLLSAGFGVWAGQNLDMLLKSPRATPYGIILLILMFYGAAAALETMEVRRLT